MNRTTFATVMGRLVPFWCFLAFCGTPLLARDTSALPPNVILVLMDDVALPDVAAVPTPTLDWLAAVGVSFRRAYAMPTCSPTRQSILLGKFTGLAAGYTCIKSKGRSPSHTEFSLPKLLKASGYETGLFGKWHAGDNRLGPWEFTPNLHGFDTWRAGIPSNVMRCGGSDYWNWTRVDDGLITTSSQYQTEALRDEFMAWWLATEGPKFAQIAFQAAHSPFHQPPAGFLPAGYVPGSTNRGEFEALIVSLDLVLGEMLSVVDLRDTWVFVLGDNGTPENATAPGQNPNKVKTTTFEGGVNVPLIVTGPGLSHSFQTDAMVHAVDLLATIAEIVGARVPTSEATDSVSFVPCLQSPKASVRSWLICDYTPLDSVGSPTMGLPQRERALITQRWKLRRYGAQVEELYDLLLDPEEKLPIDLGTLGARSDLRTIVVEMRALLDEFENRGT